LTSGCADVSIDGTNVARGVSAFTASSRGELPVRSRCEPKSRFDAELGRGRAAAAVDLLAAGRLSSTGSLPRGLSIRTMVLNDCALGDCQPPPPLFGRGPCCCLWCSESFASNSRQCMATVRAAARTWSLSLVGVAGMCFRLWPSRAIESLSCKCICSVSCSAARLRCSVAALDNCRLPSGLRICLSPVA